MKVKYLTVSIKNQITLNRDVRDTLGITAGDKVYFENTKGGLVLKKLENTEECPICKSTGVFCDDKCHICDGKGIINDEVTMEYVIGKLIHILLLNKSTNIGIQKSDEFGYIINTVSDNRVVSEYIKECQKYIIKLSLKEYVDNKVLIDYKVKQDYLTAFKGKLDSSELLLLINTVQLDIIKSILKQKSNITKEDYDMYINAFEDEYKDKVSKFLLPFATL